LRILKRDCHGLRPRNDPAKSVPGYTQLKIICVIAVKSSCFLREIRGKISAVSAFSAVKGRGDTMFPVQTENTE
jgi:hypothetical protein